MKRKTTLEILISTVVCETTEILEHFYEDFNASVKSLVLYNTIKESVDLNLEKK